jgi:5-methyltetrahydropteroyltriglutamate--homocysteine methyltransferase
VHVCRGNQADRWHREGHYDAIAERLFGTLQHQRLLLEYDSDEAGRYLSIEQLAISPQCGFASDIAGNPLGEEDQWRKLEVVRNVAAEVWG